MKRLVIAASALLLAAGAASAATTGSTNAIKDHGAQSAAAQPVPKIRQEIRDQLAKSGLTDIKVAPEEYVVHAKNKQGNPVLMVVSPNSFLEVTDVKVANRNDAQAKRDRVEPDPTPLAKQQ